MEWPALSIILITYNRPKEIMATYAALTKYLHYSGEIVVIIADDCSPDNYAHNTAMKMQVYNHMEQNNIAVVCTSQPPQNSGWGANTNLALSRCTTELILQLEDDYVLTQPIDLDAWVALLLQDDSIGLVRLDGIAGHEGVIAHTGEADVSAYCPNYREGIGSPGKLFYWDLQVESSQLWLYSNRPALKHKRFHAVYGFYPEGLKLGDTELIMASIVKQQMREHPDNAPRIVVPMLLSSCYFDHIGKSYQLTEHDKGARYVEQQPSV